MSTSLAIDYGSKYIGVSLVRHTPKVPNRALYAAVIVVEPKPLNKSIRPRVVSRRIRRTGKTRRRRLRRLAQALEGIRGAAEVLRFCTRRGYSYDRDGDAKELAHAVPREQFFEALAAEIDRVVPKRHRAEVLKRCQKHLNAARRPTAELRPARFENRHPSKCQWKGCTKNVPRKANALRQRLQQTLFVWLRPVFDQIEGKTCRELRRQIDRRIDRLLGLGRAYQKEPDAAARKVLHKQKRRAFANVLGCVGEFCDDGAFEAFTERWKKTYAKQLTEILDGKKKKESKKGKKGNKEGGRLPYCREHSREFVDVFLAGKQPPHRTEDRVSDLFGRSQQILFQRIWRLVAARLLPLAGGRIDRVVVERAAFDLLAGTFKQRQNTPEDVAAEMYWHGPMYGFDSRRAMFKEEFDGRCAYCGRKRAVIEIEHILPKSRFPFDSYFNLLPACSECNRSKGGRTASAVGMTVHEKAFEAYSAYVAGKRPPHVYHTMKKGMLKLMRHHGSLAAGQRHLAMLANNLVAISNTQKGPRPLARFLANRIERETGKRCKAEWLAGRHTGLYREIALPEFDKQEDRAENGVVHHAVDAVILGCRLPSAAALENPNWSIKQKDLLAWREEVRSAAPLLDGPLPKLEPIERLEFFENDLGNGYLQIDLSAFNWNRQRQSNCDQNPFGETAAGTPLKRKPAQDVLANLLNQQKRDAQIDAIAHKGLHRLLDRDRKQAAGQFVGWLQKTTRKGLEDGKRGNHPSDQARYEALQAFVRTPVKKFLLPKPPRGSKAKGEAAPQPAVIPETIGIRCINKGQQGKLTIWREDASGNNVQRFTTQPQYKAWYVGYRAGDDGTPDRSKPIVFAVYQTYAVELIQGRKRSNVAEDDLSLLQGVALNRKGDRKEFFSRWQAQLESLFRRREIICWFRLTHGCFIEKTDGTAFQLRNFNGQEPWMKNGPFVNISRVYRSPLHAVKRGHH